MRLERTYFDKPFSSIDFLLFHPLYQKNKMPPKQGRRSGRNQQDNAESQGLNQEE